MSSRFISPVLKDFDSQDYHFFGLWKQLVFSGVFWSSCFNEKIIKDLGLSATNLGALVLTHGNFFVKKSELKNIDTQISEKIVAGDEAFFKHMVSVADQVYQSAIKYSQSVSGQEPTIKNFEKFLEVVRSVNFLWLLGAEQFTVTTEEKLQEAVVEASFPAENVPHIIPKVITPLYRQHHEMLILKKEINSRSLEELQKDSEMYAKLKVHVEKYPWIEIANFMGESLTIERLYEQIVHAKDEPIDTSHIDLENVPEKIALRARIMGYCGYIKQAGAEHFAIVSEKALPFLKRISDHISITYREFLLLTDADILRALKGEINSTELKKIAYNRESMNIAMITGPDNKMVFIDNPSDIETLKREMIPEADKTSTEIKGQIGNVGKYTGKVKVVMNTEDFGKLLPGEVLVTTMTTPDFVILMQKAGAIVTDIGGMLCHAAIVSREINKPCIIGTKFATKILKDGDMVEVDADKGIVRIIT